MRCTEPKIDPAPFRVVVMVNTLVPVLILPRVILRVPTVILPIKETVLLAKDLLSVIILNAEAHSIVASALPES